MVGMRMKRKKVGVAMGVSLVLMVVSAVVVKAAPVAQEEPVQMSLLMAAIVGFVFYLGFSSCFSNVGFSAV